MSLVSSLRALLPSQDPIKLHIPIDVAMPTAELWPLLSNTQRMNPAVGFPSILFTPLQGQVGQLASTRFLGLRFNWKELPFEWVDQREFRVERVFKGIAERVLVGANFTALDAEHTRVEVIAEVIPRNYPARLITLLVLERVMGARFRQLLRTFEQNYQQGKHIIFPSPSKPQVDAELLNSLEMILRAIPRLDDGLIDRLTDHLRESADEEVTRMKPFALADRWGASRTETLRIFLHATRLGLLDLQWEMLCPNCRVSKASYSTLADLQEQAHCESCHITFDANFDQYVELRFTANPRVRTAEGSTYCVGGPFITPHIKVQVRVPAGATRRVSIPLPAGNYHLRCLGRPARTAFSLVEEGNAPIEDKLEVDEQGPRLSALRLTRSEQGALELFNKSNEEILFIVEQNAWDQDGVSAAVVTSMQEFRDLFGSEVLAPGLSIEIRTLTFLFSDLKNSTVMYEEAGDSMAYTQVRDHFVALTAAISAHQGAIVKTIGDAVMAIFTSPNDALQAAIDSQHAIARLNEANPTRPALRLKLGLHTGPCIAITANNVIDYFGSTVNAAARIQGISIGGDIILSQEVADDPRVTALLAPYSTVEQFPATLKGLTSTFVLYRLWPLPHLWGPADKERTTVGGLSS
ncbi:MAG: hypothetical protein H0T73_19320 [Ardenticatenales bacterium]|nr:hypothetical protein [Ardenticatenales bacterium]